MSHWNLVSLSEPISPDLPCGQNLEDSGELAMLEAYQIFGQVSLDPAAPEPGAPVPRETRKNKSDRPPNWNELGDLAAGMLTKTRDLRILMHLGAASLWTDGPRPFVQCIAIASKWLTDYWSQVFPLIDEDAVFRRNALNSLSDRASILEGLRRAPLVESRQHGRVTFRDIQLATGAQKLGDTDTPVDEQRIAAAFAEMPVADLRALHASLRDGQAALAAIDETSRGAAGIEAVPDVEALTGLLQQMQTAVGGQLARHPDAVEERAAAGDMPGTPGGAGLIAVGAIRSRDDAIRALDAAAEFFRRNEPSSPVPLLVDRAKRLIAKDFLEVIADVAPDALAQARAVGGLRD